MNHVSMSYSILMKSEYTQAAHANVKLGYLSNDAAFLRLERLRQGSHKVVLKRGY